MCQKLKSYLKKIQFDSFGNTTSIEYKNTFPEGETTFSGQESNNSRKGNQVNYIKNIKFHKHYQDPLVLIKQTGTIQIF